MGSDDRCSGVRGGGGFNLLRSNRASDAEQPWVISLAIGRDDVLFISTSIIPWRITFLHIMIEVPNNKTNHLQELGCK